MNVPARKDRDVFYAHEKEQAHLSAGEEFLCFTAFRQRYGSLKKEFRNNGRLPFSTSPLIYSSSLF
ncbi:hypothetical protein HMPREF3038_01724 [Akkermansia sp. KLE1797]|nr:hypothetical protein HMPREF3038_01724 [Akkermansia sp. KLE1797]KXU53928.1 hypothetical protein HMPREF3039_01883 [Akkermansia sp. KLE1798]KZA03107.1 hypothetical protein HMPREF1326_03151 [Akkermansia sp. KLE1605]